MMDDRNDTPPQEGTQHLADPKLCFDNDCIEGDALSDASVTLYREGSFLFSSASVRGVPPENSRWDYNAKTTLFDDQELIRTGLCVKSVFESGGSMHFELRSAFWELEQTTTDVIGFFGMEQNERRYWFLRLCGQGIGDLKYVPDNTPRPFLYAVPLKGLKATNKPFSFRQGSSGVASGKYDDVFAPLLAQSEFANTTPEWSDEVPKAYGFVYATDMLEAEKNALARASLTADILGFSLRTGVSHLESRYENEPVEWDAEAARIPVAPHPYIMIVDSKNAKGWIRSILTPKPHNDVEIHDHSEKIRLFVEQFERASETGDFFDQVHNPPTGERERKLALGIQRSLRWQAIAAEEHDARDRFSALWIALESILNAVEFPGVFDKSRHELRNTVKEQIQNLPIPERSDEPLEVSKDMLIGRILQGQWPLYKKLKMFELAFGVALRPDDLKLVRKLSSERARIFHAHDDDPDLSNPQIQKLQYLVERLTVTASTMGYVDIEDDEQHQLMLGQMGPEGGAAPLFLNGREVPYDAIYTQDSAGKPSLEFIIEGKIYSSENAIPTSQQNET